MDSLKFSVILWESLVALEVRACMMGRDRVYPREKEWRYVLMFGVFEGGQSQFVIPRSVL